MNLAVRTSIYGDRPPDEVARLAAVGGFDAVVLQLGSVPGEFTAALAGRLADVYERAGLAIAALAVPGDLLSDPAAMLAQLEAAMPVVTQLGTDVILVGCGAGDDWTAALAPLQEALREAEERQVALAVEIGPGSALADLDDLETLLDALDTESMGLALHLGPLAAANRLSGVEVLERVGDALDVVVIDSAEGGEWLPLLAEAAPETIVVVEGDSPGAAAELRAKVAGTL